MKKKAFGTILLAPIVLVFYLIASQRLPLIVTGDQFIGLKVDGVQCVVAAFDVSPVWAFSTQIKSKPEKLERWRELVLVGQSDALKFFDNQEASDMYGRAAITNEMVEKQRNYAIDRFRDQSNGLKVTRVFIVQETSAKVAHLLVPINGPQGEYFTSLEWINGSWYLMPGLGETAWAVLNAKKIMQASESQGIKILPSEKIDSVMRKL